MRKITTVLSLVMLITLMSSCKDESSLQAYLVDSQEKAGFMTFDLPVSFLKLSSEDVSEEVKNTLESIHKVNVVALPVLNNKDAYDTEKTKLKNIFKNSDKYKSLMRMNAKGMKVSLYYTGTGDAIDEVIAFGYADDKGVGIARILGDNMNPSMIIKMMENIKLDPSNLNLKQFNLAFE